MADQGHGPDSEGVQQLLVGQREVEHVLQRLEARGAGHARMERRVHRVARGQAIEKRRPAAPLVEGVEVDDVGPAARRPHAKRVLTAGVYNRLSVTDAMMEAEQVRVCVPVCVRRTSELRASVAREMPVVAVDHCQAGTHVAGKVEG